TIRTANHLVDGADAELCHYFAKFLGDEAHEVDHMIRITPEFGAERRVLRSNTDRTSIQVTNTHHDASHRDQRRRGETEFLAAQQCSDGDVPPGVELPSGLDVDAAAQVVEHE